MVTRELQVKRTAGHGKADVLPLCYATTQLNTHLISIAACET